MPEYSQTNNVFRVHTPLGEDVLLLRRIRGTEGISELFDFELDVLADNRTDVAFDAILGQSVTVSVHVADGSPVRWMNGICAEFEEGARETLEADKKTFTSYRIRLVPRAWLLGLVHGSRVFQEMAVPDILRKVLVGFPADYCLEKSYEPREMCLQYRESDLAFALRLMEEEGIRFYFQHGDGDHTLVVTDSGAFPDLPGETRLLYDPLEGGTRDEGRVTAWRKRQALTRGKVTLRDRSFELPSHTLEREIVLKETLPVGTETHRLPLAGAGARELYGFPGGHAKPFDGVAPGGGERPDELQKIFPYGELRARVIMEREETRAVEISGASSVRHVVPGYAFTLDRHHDGNGKYLLTRVTHDGENGLFRTGNAPDRYENAITCLPAAAVYRPQRRTRRPVAQGPETAIVVGPKGEEIYVDKYGRIKVQFYWDREGKKDVWSCAWLRVATPLAGNQWGGWAFPRIGQEVLVAFQHGDPDEPVVTGALYNAENMPPYVLPENKNRTGLRTRSTLRAAADEYHEVRFDDTKEKEEIFVQSQKDFHRLVKNNDWLQVGVKKGSAEPPDGSQKEEIWKNRTVHVGKGDDTLFVGKLADEPSNVSVDARSSGEPGQSPSKGGNQKVVIANDRSTTLVYGNDRLVVGEYALGKSTPRADLHQGNQSVVVANDRTTTIQNGNDRLTIQKGNLDVSLPGADGGKVTVDAFTSIVLTAKSSIELKVGLNTLKIDTTGIELKAGATTSLKLDATSAELKTATGSLKLDVASATLKSVTTKVQGDATADLKAPVASVKGDGLVNVSAPLVKIG